MQDELIITGARVHNLQNVSLTIPRNKLVVFTGLSGSGKSSLAFDTIYAEGQRRYMESLSAYARQFLDKMDKPDVDRIDGLSPAISIDQKSASHNPRSTVGTVTEIYDYFRLLFASVGKPHCHQCDHPIQSQSVQEMVDHMFTWPENTEILILSPLVQEKKGEFRSVLAQVHKDGFSRVRIDDKVFRITDPVPLDKNKKHTIDIVVDKLSIHAENRGRIFESMETAVRKSKGMAVVEVTQTKTSHLFSELLSCPNCNISLAELSPRLFSFNSPIGACLACNGLGSQYDFDPDLVIDDPDLPAKRATGKVLNLEGTHYGRMAEKSAKFYGFTLNTPFSKLTEKEQNVLLYGSPKKIAENPYINSKEDELDFTSKIEWEGVITNLRRRYLQTHSEGMRFFFRNYMSEKPCQACQGARLKPEVLSVKVQGVNIGHLMDLSIEQLADFIKTLTLTPKELEIAKMILKEITQRLDFLKNVGLNYLSLSRKAGTLSGGEFQRIRLATQIGSGLTGVLYVLDEPSIGLHQRDNLRLIETLVHLRELGNTLIVVEHDEDTIRMADHIVDIGPGAGKEGGKILFSGTLPELLVSDDSITAKYLNKIKEIEIPKKRRTFAKQPYLTIVGARENNLKNITVPFPLGKFICVTGVSGSGKSSLINDILHTALMRHFYKSKERPGLHDKIEGLEHLDKVITIDQSPIGRTPRSNPATYTALFTPIRDLFSQTRDAKMKGYKAGRFSFNVKGGRCEACEGDGVVKIEMHFLSDVYVTCEICKGKRYNTQTLDVTYKGFTISDILNMTVSEAKSVFVNIPAILPKLETLEEVGLGYIQLGQSATTLSGGEAQRIKLAKELSKRSTGKTLYLLDEPTTGLHFADIHHLLGVLNQLVIGGNTIIVIEHNLDVIKTADHVIDIGPEGGFKGGQVVAMGTPEEIAQNPQSYTGQFLKKIL